SGVEVSECVTWPWSDPPLALNDLAACTSPLWQHSSGGVSDSGRSLTHWLDLVDRWCILRWHRRSRAGMPTLRAVGLACVRVCAARPGLPARGAWPAVAPERRRIPACHRDRARLSRPAGGEPVPPGVGWGARPCV